jgi:integrase
VKLLAAKNQSIEQPYLNKGMAKVYLPATSPEFLKRTWGDVMEHYALSGTEPTRERKRRAFESRPFAALKSMKLVETEAIHVLTVIEHRQSGNSTQHYIRRLHNFALNLGWLLGPIIAHSVWPKTHKKRFTALTESEHDRIIAKEANPERRLYYQMLWETGGSQTDISALNWFQIDLEDGLIRFNRRKLMGKESGDSMLRIGPRILALLKELPQKGDLFPRIKNEKAHHRSSEFSRRCKTLGIKGRTLHSYRYAWAQRAKSAGMPEREAMNHLGHKSRAIHAAYAGGAQAAVLPLEFYESEKAKKILKFDLQTEEHVENSEKSV